MKTVIFFILLGINCRSQHREILDTIYSNQFNNVALFFPNEIQQGIVGHENFTFSYNKNTPQYFGLLKALPGTVSNLLVITSEGSVYSYVVKHSDKLPQLNYFFRREDHIGRERGKGEPDLDSIPPKPLGVLSIEVNGKKDSLPEAYYQNVSRFLLRTTGNKTISADRDGKVIFRLKNIAYRGDKTFLVLEIANKSSLDFKPDYVKIYFATGSERKKSSYQRLPQRPLYSYELPQIIRATSKAPFVMVVPKFAPGKYRHLEIQIGEGIGGGTLKLTH